VTQVPGHFVFVVDDEARVRRALERLIRSSGFEVRSFGSAREFLAKRPTERPACLVLDLSMPDLNGLELQEAMKESGITTPTIFLTGRGKVSASVRALKAGALDFLEKPVDDLVLLEAIEKALEKDRTALESEADLDLLQGRYDSLTPREREVCALVATGIPNKQVAYRLGTSEKTIKVHRGRVMRKLKADSLAHLVRMVDALNRSGPARPTLEESHGATSIP
jgi:FixJ family two-component response regulator